jgi:hypothetical protein
MKNKKNICYVCNNEIKSNKFTMLPKSNKYPRLYRHSTKCYPGTMNWEKFINGKRN